MGAQMDWPNTDNFDAASIDFQRFQETLLAMGDAIVKPIANAAKAIATITPPLLGLEPAIWELLEKIGPILEELDNDKQVTHQRVKADISNKRRELMRTRGRR